MEKKMETIIMGYRGTTIRMHSFIPSQPKISCWQWKMNWKLTLKWGIHSDV